MSTDFFNNDAIWIHEIKWFLDSFTEQKAVNTEYLRKLKFKHKTFFENSENQLILVILFIFWIGNFSMGGNTIPTSSIDELSDNANHFVDYFFMAKPMIDYFDSLEEIKLQKIRHQIEVVYEKIKQTQSQSLQQIHQKIVKQKHLLQKNLERTKFTKMSPDIRPNFNYSTSSHSELDQEVRRLRQNQRQDLLNQINTQLGKKAYDYYLPKIDLMYSLVTKEKYSFE